MTVAPLIIATSSYVKKLLPWEARSATTARWYPRHQTPKISCASAWNMKLHNLGNAEDNIQLALEIRPRDLAKNSWPPSSNFTTCALERGRLWAVIGRYDDVPDGYLLSRRLCMSFRLDLGEW